MTDGLEAFRAETRAWLEENYPVGLRTTIYKGPEEDQDVWGGKKCEWVNPDRKIWLDRMASRGWTAPTWPKKYGGGGLSRGEAKVLADELARSKCKPPLFSLGISMLGPALLEFGTEAQRAEHLPPIARGDIRWCQGYSEPGAGSDLASLQCKAMKDGDSFIVSGRKVWTSGADKSDWIFCLVRTDSTVPKHEGISFLLIDMDSPGVSTSPIRLISGDSPFCETVFDEVRVPAGNLVGELNKGWSISKRVLQFERAMVSGMGQGAEAGSEKARVDGTRPRSLHALYKANVDPSSQMHKSALADEIIQAEMGLRAFQLTMTRTVEEAKTGSATGQEVAMLKLVGSELNSKRAELRVRILGTQGLGWGDVGFDEQDLMFTREWLSGKAGTIAGGSSEIQKNIIAKRILGLPD
ncbi:MAG: acyl-CoA dehydrogenase [Opitutales bacterium]|jgi:alkylation response protein AidB-like acyl-CoA dehydrogenase|nr:acyl-CoA dehydrogenase [Opitutales bacterium]